MLRAAIMVLLTIGLAGTASAADQIIIPKRHHIEPLPPGLPRAHYQFRTTIVVAPPPVYVVPDPDLLITPVYGPIHKLAGPPLLPGSAALPGYYGRASDYDDEGPYYGGPYTPYWDRLPYACGVYGYC